MENNELALAIGIFITTHAAAIGAALWKFGSKLIEQIINYKKLERDILELQKQRDRDHAEFKETTERIFKDIRGVRGKIKD